MGSNIPGKMLKSLGLLKMECRLEKRQNSREKIKTHIINYINNTHDK